MTEPVKRTTPAQQAQNTQKAQQPKQKPEQHDPSIGRLLVNRAGAVVMTPVAGLAGTITIIAKGISGAVNPDKTLDQGIQEGIQAASESEDMLDKMWQGKFF